MAASFPSSIKTFTTKTDSVDFVQAAHVNDLQNEVTAIETELLPMLRGWTLDSVAWVRTGANTFTRAGATSDIFPVGAKIRYKDGGSYEYGYVTDLTGTTVTFTGGSDYTMAAATITDRYISYAASPAGFPDWFNWSPTLGGWSSAPTSSAYRFRIAGRTCEVNVSQLGNGTSNATTLTISAPVQAKTVANAIWAAVGQGFDNGTVTAGIYGRIGSAGTDLQFFSTVGGAGWTNSGVKRIAAWQCSYEIG
jgi:hypothetical protein